MRCAATISWLLQENELARKILQSIGIQLMPVKVFKPAQ